MTSELRRAKRRALGQPVTVLDTMTEAMAGRLANLSSTGMLLITHLPLMDDALFQFRFTLTEPDGHERTIELGAHQLWSDSGPVPGQFWAGFRFIDLDPEDAAFLQAWVEEPGARYA
ncbi:MAG: PilZ domain-containing protein [Rehaibacterium terrae]|jgi:hypothetical protein|uniref:PilZ domain-containing protein n=1 Tax=Rehaibacterium terrae TaxID=1341696 RepID=UPI00391CD200